MSRRKTRSYYLKRPFAGPFVPDRAICTDVVDETKLFKVLPGWYRLYGLHLVETRAASQDGGIDWVAVKSAVDAFKLYHGNSVDFHCIEAIHNTRRDLIGYVERFREKGFI